MQDKLFFGTLLRTERKKRGLTQEELAELADNVCTGSYISYLERKYVEGVENLPKPDVLVIDALAMVLKIPPKVARDAAGLSLPSESGEEVMSGIFSMLFVGYERLNPVYRQMAISLCGGILNNLYEIQVANSGNSPRNTKDRSKDESELTPLPVIHATTEAEITSKEKVLEISESQ